jgi:4-amino-4-deoxy-L-arabinose transferase-like glycosyltransferase
VLLLAIVREEIVSFPRVALLGVLLGIAALTRPAGVYLPVVYAVLIACAPGRRSLSRRTLAAGLVLVSSAALLGPWVVRNDRLFGITRLSNADSINLAYFAAAGVYQLQDHATREQAEARLRREFDLVPLVAANNFWLASQEPRHLDAQQRRAAREVIGSHPLLFLEASARGVLKSLVSHNVDALAALCGLTWHGPGLGTLAERRWGEFVAALATNPWWLSLAYAWQLTTALAVLLLAAVGIAVGAMRPSLRFPVAVLVTLAGYHCLTTVAVGLEAYSRHRSPAVPLFCVLASVALFGRGRSVPRYRGDGPLAL